MRFIDIILQLGLVNPQFHLYQTKFATFLKKTREKKKITPSGFSFEMYPSFFRKEINMFSSLYESGPKNLCNSLAPPKRKQNEI